MPNGFDAGPPSRGLWVQSACQTGEDSVRSPKHTSLQHYRPAFGLVIVHRRTLRCIAGPRVVWSLQDFPQLCPSFAPEVVGTRRRDVETLKHGVYSTTDLLPYKTTSPVRPNALSFVAFTVASSPSFVSHYRLRCLSQ